MPVSPIGIFGHGGHLLDVRAARFGGGNRTAVESVATLGRGNGKHEGHTLEKCVAQMSNPATLHDLKKLLKI